MSDEDAQILAARLAAPVSQFAHECKLSVQAQKALLRWRESANGPSTVAELVEHSWDDLLKVKNIGVNAAGQIRSALAANGLSLSEKSPEALFVPAKRNPYP